MDSALDEDKSELAILVLAIFLQVLSHVDSLLDEVVEVFRDFWSQSILLQDSEDLTASDTFDLRNSIVISENYTDLRGRAAFLC